MLAVGLIRIIRVLSDLPQCFSFQSCSLGLSHSSVADSGVLQNIFFSCEPNLLFASCVMEASHICVIYIYTHTHPHTNGLPIRGPILLLGLTPAFQSVLPQALNKHSSRAPAY